MEVFHPDIKEKLMSAKARSERIKKGFPIKKELIKKMARMVFEEDLYEYQIIESALELFFKEKGY